MPLPKPDNRVDSMLMDATSRIRDSIYAGQLDPMRAEFRLERLLDDNRRSDFLLRRVFATLARPSLSSIERWLTNATQAGAAKGIEKDAYALLKTFNWAGAPHEVDVTRGCMKNLFIPHAESQTEGRIRTAGKTEGLLECPDWIVPALCLHAAEHATTSQLASFDINICLASDEGREYGLCLRYHKEWYLYVRSARPNVPWSSGELYWLFVKPREVPLFK